MSDNCHTISRRAALRFSIAAAAASAGALIGCRPTPTARITVHDSTPGPSGVLGSGSTALPLTSTPRSSSDPDSSQATDINQGIVYASHGDPKQSKLAVTIDDFSYPTVVTDKLLPILANNPDLRLTLFPIGDRIPVVEQTVPGLWQSLLTAGHEIGFHSMHHTDLGKKTTSQLLDEVEQFNRAVSQVTGSTSFSVRYGRPPYGNYGDRTQFSEIAKKLGITWVTWSTVPSSADAMPLDVPQAITPGDIALFHIRWQDMAKLPPYITACRQRGLRLVTLSQLALVPSA